MILAQAPDDALTSTLVEKASLAILDMIEEQIVSSGQQTVELRLAKKLGISRTPIRQALQLLEGEGLLRKSVGRSYIVKRIDLRGIFAKPKGQSVTGGRSRSLRYRVHT